MIVVKELKKTFWTRTSKKGKEEVQAVKDISMQVKEGEIFGLLGPNGAGKSTTMRMLATLLQPSGGSAKVAGCDLIKDQHEIRSRIGYVGQNGGSKPWETGLENIVSQGRLYGLNKKQAREKGEELLAELDLVEIMNRKCKTYSGGQRRRLDLAIGMIHQPRLLFLDEPTTGLDPHSRAQFWQYIRKIRESGMTIFLSTHYLDEADALCDRVAIVDRGIVEAEGSPDQLKHELGGGIVTIRLSSEMDKSAKTSFAAALQTCDFVREVHWEDEVIRLHVNSSSNILLEVSRMIDQQRVITDQVSHSRPSLDDVFLSRTGRSMKDVEQNTTRKDGR